MTINDAQLRKAEEIYAQVPDADLERQPGSTVIVDLEQKTVHAAFATRIEALQHASENHLDPGRYYVRDRTIAPLRMR